MVVFIVFIICVSILLLLTSLIRHRYAYWKIRDVPYTKPVFPKGTLEGVGKQFHFGELIQRQYFEHKDAKHPFFGGFILTQPMAIVTDINLAKKILIKDFNYFMDRPLYYNERDDPLSGNLFHLTGATWKNRRSAITPVFTSGKLRNMTILMLRVVANLETIILARLNKTGGRADIPMKNILSQYTLDVIGTCMFGFESNCLNGLNADYQKYALSIFESPRLLPLIRQLCNMFPKIAKKCKIKTLRDEVSSFFFQLFKDVAELRDKSGVIRNDFLSMLIDLKNSPRPDSAPLTLNEIYADAFVFLVAGFETSSTTMGFALYELAKNPELQENVRQHILDVLLRYDGLLCYNAVKDMTVLERVISETLRKYPALPVLLRSAVNDYHVEGTPYVIEKGITVAIPIYGFHYDPEYWDDPESFDPDRFAKQKDASRNPFSFLPFGEGPRNCIGMRFGNLQVAAGLAGLLRNFKFSICDKTQNHPKMLPIPVNLIMSGENWLKVEKI